MLTTAPPWFEERMRLEDVSEGTENPAQGLIPELICQVCKKPLRLLLQIYTPGNPEDNLDYRHRIIYIFTCKTGQCHKNPSQCFRVIRSQLPINDADDKDTTPSNPNLCYVCGLPGPKTCAKCHKVNYCSRDHQVVHWGLGHKECCGKDDSVVSEIKKLNEKLLGQNLFPEYPIEIEEELLDEDEEKANKDDDADDDDDEEEDEGVDENNPENMKVDQPSDEGVKERTLDYRDIKKDQIFMKFHQRISYYRDQILRYARIQADQQYEPLWVSDSRKPTADDIKPCPHCNSPRTFEFQIMPQLINHLQIDDTQADSIDWGTLLIYSCPKSCSIQGKRTYADEILIRQNFSSIGVPVQKDS